MNITQRQLYGHTEAEEIWLDGFNNNKLHHAWLIHGDKGIGKAAFAHKIARFMISNPKLPSSSLEVNASDPSVIKLVNRSHPDFFILESELYKDGKFEKNDIKVDEVRSLNKFLAFTQVLSKYKIVIIDAVDDLNVNAANALLKFLEEPFTNTYFLLVCNSSNVLPTIRSRCRLLQLRMPQLQDFTQALKQIKEVDMFRAEHIYNLTNGSLYYAQMLLNQEIEPLLEEIEKIFSGKITLSNIIKLARKINDDYHFEVFSYVVTNLLKNKIHSVSMEGGNPEELFNIFDKVKDLLHDKNNFNLDSFYVAQEVIHTVQN